MQCVYNHHQLLIILYNDDTYLNDTNRPVSSVSELLVCWAFGLNPITCISVFVLALYGSSPTWRLLRSYFFLSSYSLNYLISSPERLRIFQPINGPSFSFFTMQLTERWGELVQHVKFCYLYYSSRLHHSMSC
jgi:hypothetical protein